MFDAWRKFWGWSWWAKGPVIAFAGIIVLVIIIVAVGGGEEEGDKQVSADADQPAAEEQEDPTETPEPTQTPVPTETPVPVPTATPAPEPISLSGTGQTATDPINIPFSIPVVTLTHSGSSNFIVEVYQDGELVDFLVNVIGSYDGQRPLLDLGEGPVFFDVTADGPWTMVIDQVGLTGDASFSGEGDAVSGIFAAPDGGPWEISHDGDSNFVVWAHCDDGTDLVQNEIGPVSVSTVVAFDGDVCFWEVEANGSWGLAPRG